MQTAKYLLATLMLLSFVSANAQKKILGFPVVTTNYEGFQSWGSAGADLGYLEGFGFSNKLSFTSGYRRFFVTIEAGGTANSGAVFFYSPNTVVAMVAGSYMAGYGFNGPKRTKIILFTGFSNGTGTKTTDRIKQPRDILQRYEVTTFPYVGVPVRLTVLKYYKVIGGGLEAGTNLHKHPTFSLTAVIHLGLGRQRFPSLSLRDNAVKETNASMGDI